MNCSQVQSLVVNGADNSTVVNLSAIAQSQRMSALFPGHLIAYGSPAHFCNFYPSL